MHRAAHHPATTTFSTAAHRLAAAALALVALGSGCGGGRPYGYSQGYQSGTQYTNNGYGNPAYGNNGAYAGNGAQPGATPGGATGAMAMITNADRALRVQGYQPMGSVVQQPLPNRGLIAFPINAQPGVCYAVFAVGDVGSQDVDLEVVSPAGMPLGADRNVDVHPHVEFCASEYGVHLARVNMFAGAGNVFFAAYQGTQRIPANLTGAFEGHPAGATAAQTASAPDPVTAARIQAVRAQLGAQGYRDIRPVVGVTMPTGSTQDWPSTLPAGLCYAFATFGGPGVRDSDIFLYSVNPTRQVAGDARTNVDALVQDFCPPTTGQYILRPRLYTGSGPIFFLAMSRPNAAAGAPPVPTETQAPLNITTVANTVGGGVEGLFNGLSRSLQTVGYGPPENPTGSHLQTGQSAPATVTLQPGSCYAIGAVGESTVQDLDLALLDPAGREIDRDYATDAQPMVRVCPTAAGAYTVQVRMSGGQGQFRLGVFRWGGGLSGAGMSGVMFVRNAEVTRTLQVDRYVGDADFELVRGHLQQGHPATRSVTLQTGACYAFAAVGGQGVSEVSMTLSQGRNVLQQANQLTAIPVVRYCATAAGQFNIAIESSHGTGDYVFRVFRRQDGRAAVAQ